MKFCKRFLKLLLISSFYNSFANGENPKIVFERNSTAKWTNVTLVGEGLAFYSDKGEDLYASCSAPDPIIWDIAGFINPVSIIRMREPERTYNPDKFTIRLAAFFNTAKDLPFLASSLRIRCKNTKSFTESDFSLYVKGNLNGTLLPPKSNLIDDSFLIPCTTTAPLEPVTLFKLNGAEEVKVEDVDYIPWYGFLRRHKNFYEGVYFCRQGSSEIKFNVKSSSETVSFIPWWEDKVRSFSDKEIYFSCYSNSNEKVELKFEGDSKLNISYSKNSTWDKSVKISPVDKKSKRIEGKVSCWKKDILVNEWTFEFIKAPELYLDDHFNKLHCLTDFEEADGVEVEAKSLSCSNDVACRYYQKCLGVGEGLVCDDLEQVVYSEKRRTQCAPLVDSKGRVCVNLHSWNGVAQCKVNGLSRTWNYFTALDLRTYTDWNKVDKNDLLRLEKEEEKPNGFRCAGVGFLFANSLAFELEFKDNSIKLLQGEGEDGKVTIHEHPNPYKIQRFQVVSSLELLKPDNVKSIKCIGSFWNSTEIVKTPAYNL